VAAATLAFLFAGVAGAEHLGWLGPVHGALYGRPAERGAT
jgi:hypothetical protein